MTKNNIIQTMLAPTGQPVRCALSLSSWLRRYSAHPWASPLRGQRMRCSKLRPAILCRTPPDCATCEKKPVLAYELFLKYGGEAGLTRFARPFGAACSLRSQSVPLAAPLLGPSLGLASTGLAYALFKIAPGNFVSNPGPGFSPRQTVQHAKKKARTCVRALLKIWR